MTPTNDKPMTVEALIALGSVVGDDDPQCWSGELAFDADVLRAAIEQYGREREAAGQSFDAWQANPYTQALQKSIQEDYVPREEQYGDQRETSGFECGVLAEFKATERQAGRGRDEPVAWGQLGTLNGQLFLRSNYDRAPYPPPPSIVRSLNLVRLYTAPQSREPLTDEQINQLWCACLSIENHSFSRDFARAIERAHGIRSEG